ncbi:two-component system CheB/CheR fusion protein [Algoriphagus ratkowskyi]|uniref:histidine kinase n=1 Tax=Algoriphagus ratkowskyi TaxID=57028 RepID=A0A2W7R1L6_9BACT|nr:chemotaxis protein CheB [Algoriphagus ratkowskyi]PZX53136.1 two-component system CheB/CheR fusion protein [Algoriphagus ratkowskyi]TXD76414.1 chemotaxis protein CheR [Algoriphagus ratkowskyi]
MKNKENNFYIIAIGASAGGMEAIHLLFDHTPEDGVAYVIIQHLSPDHKSFMSALLAKHSKLKISIAENGMYVEPNLVYLMPQGKYMTIKDRRLFLTDIIAKHPNTAIDIFFDSLASSHKDKSIAVILSGTGSDGTKGIAAIKRHGGFVIVQDPLSAKFDGMPNSAILSGNVDVILSPDRIPKEIIGHLERGLLENNLSDRLSETNEDALVKILGLIQKHTPLDFTEYKRPTIIRRIAIRMTKNKVETLENFADFLEDNPSEISILAKEFLISVTKFFRDKAAFEVIENKVIPEIIDNKLQVDILKVWVVGCATGEEAYSLAIIILEQLTERQKNLEVKIFASDIDKSALLHASKGIYSDSIINDISKERLNKFFVKQGDHYKVSDTIRKMLIFADHDIVKQPPYGKIDLISCRNLLIYINPILQKKILASLHFCLNLRGYLFLGPNESLGELKKSFLEVNKKWRIFKSIEKVSNFKDSTYSTPALANQLGDLDQNSTSPKGALKSTLTEMVNSSLLDVTGYEAAIWIDYDFKIVHALGNIEKFLLPKIFNFNLLEMLPENLSIATSTTIRKALKNEKETSILKVKFERNGTLHSVNATVKPLLKKDHRLETKFLVLFSEDKTKKITNTDTEHFGKEEHTYRHLEDLKEELSETKQKLKEANDALEESNDNISSYNEELISSNEEMQSINEELQSVNEELQTVNNEYQLKIRELAELNDDLNNYFKSTISAQLYVDRELVLRKFSPSAIRQINLKDSDIGRTLSDISNNLRFSTLMDDIEKVITSSATVQKEVQTLDGRWYQMMGIPYVKQQDNQIHGVIITFNDITALKKVQDKLSRLNTDHNTFIYAVSHDLKGPLSNLALIISHLYEAINPKSEDINELMVLLEKSTANLSDIIYELTDISKIESEMDMMESINVQELLREVELSIKVMLVKSDAKITYDLKETEIQFSKKSLRSLMFNIFSNAIKYKSPDRPLEVTIRTEKSDKFTLLSIQDNGLGIAKDKIKKIFGVFQRAHRHVEGSGVGLYLAKKTITNAGGDIEVESELGKGSIFKVYFINNPRH